MVDPMNSSHYIIQTWNVTLMSGYRYRTPSYIPVTVSCQKQCFSISNPYPLQQTLSQWQQQQQLLLLLIMQSHYQHLSCIILYITNMVPTHVVLFGVVFPSHMTTTFYFNLRIQSGVAGCHCIFTPSLYTLFRSTKGNIQVILLTLYQYCHK